MNYKLKFSAQDPDFSERFLRARLHHWRISCHSCWSYWKAVSVKSRRLCQWWRSRIHGTSKITWHLCATSTCHIHSPLCFQHVQFCHHFVFIHILTNSIIHSQNLVDFVRFLQQLCHVVLHVHNGIEVHFWHCHFFLHHRACFFHGR